MKPSTPQRTLKSLLLLLLSSALLLAACGSDAAELVDDATDTVEDVVDGDDDTMDDEADHSDDDTMDDDTMDDDTMDDDTMDDDTMDDDTTTASTGTANTADVVAAADALIASLSDDEASAMMYDFGDSTITSGWSNLPACTSSDRGVVRNGLYHEDMSEEQVALSLALAATVLSDEGYAEFTDVILADDYLQDTLGNTIWDSECYAMAIFGTPSTTDAFAVQFGGHHIARMATYEGDTVTVTPAFTGIEPGTFSSDGTDYDVMGDEMDAMFAIFTSLDSDQAASAELSSAPGTIEMGPGTDSPFPDTEGLSVSELSEDQQALVVAAMATFVEDFDSSVSATLMAEYESELSETTIAWATGIDRETSGAYARIDGPNVWIEVSNEDGATGIHFHGIYRDKSDDYGDAS